MAPEDSPSGQRTPDPPSSATGDSQGDPWLAFGYLVSGVLVYGGIGWGLDRWLGTELLVVLGILTGVALALYQTWARFRPPSEKHPHDQQAQQ